jgi:hypothetical protein
MKTASIQELKQELQETSQNKLLDLCLRLAKFKKENKELLTYLLFEAHDEEVYISSVKVLIDEGLLNYPKPALISLKKACARSYASPINTSNTQDPSRRKWHC